MRGTWVLLFSLGACAPAVNLRVQARCGYGAPPAYASQSATLPLALRSTARDRLEVTLGPRCTFSARLQQSAGSPWRPARRYLVEPSRCELEDPAGGAARSVSFGPAEQRDRNILDGPPTQSEASYVFVDLNDDVDLALYGRQQGGELWRFFCERRAPR